VATSRRLLAGAPAAVRGWPLTSQPRPAGRRHRFTGAIPARYPGPTRARRRRPSGSSPWRGPSGSSPWRGPSGSSPWRGPSGSSPWRGPSGSSPWRGPSGSSLPPQPDGGGHPAEHATAAVPGTACEPGPAFPLRLGLQLPDPLHCQRLLDVQIHRVLPGSGPRPGPSASRLAVRPQPPHWANALFRCRPALAPGPGRPGLGRPRDQAAPGPGRTACYHAFHNFITAHQEGWRERPCEAPATTARRCPARPLPRQGAKSGPQPAGCRDR
jgi:hypothetical protein